MEKVLEAENFVRELETEQPTAKALAQERLKKRVGVSR
jgi:hypothetical protein